MKWTFLSDDDANGSWRFRLDDGGDSFDFITLSEEEVSMPSDDTSDDAKVLYVRSAVDLTTREAVWLHKALGELLEQRLKHLAALKLAEEKAEKAD